jgi:hypothetical protein
MTTSTALKVVDELGALLDQIELLTEQAESHKDQIKLLGKCTYRGAWYVTTIKVTEEKKSTSWASVAKEANVPAELVAKHTKVTYNILSATTEALSN